MITTFFPLTPPRVCLMEKESSRAWVGCSCAPSPALTMRALTCLARKSPAPSFGCLITMMSTFIDRMLLTVSIRDSPFLTEDWAAEKLMMSADSLFSASSKESLVRVLFSKKRLAIVMSRREGTFLIGLLITSLK